MTRSEMSSTLTVWYNTKCAVCNTGIEWQHRRLLRAARAGAIEFRDIDLEPDVLSRFGAGVEDVRRRLNAVDAEGRLLVGADCAMDHCHLAPNPGRRLARTAAWPPPDPSNCAHRL